MSITIEQRTGTRLEVVDENIQFIEQMIIDDPDFDGCNLTISGSPPRRSQHIRLIPAPRASIS